MSQAYLAKVGMTVPLLRIPLHGYVQGTDYVVDCDLVVDEDISECALIGSETGWAEVSSDGGTNYYAITDDRTTTHDLGSQTAGTRTSLKIKINVSGAVDLRERILSITMGLGVE